MVAFGVLVPVLVLTVMILYEGLTNVVTPGFEELAIFVLTLSGIAGGISAALGLWMIDAWLADRERDYEWHVRNEGMTTQTASSGGYAITADRFGRRR